MDVFLSRLINYNLTRRAKRLRSERRVKTLRTLQKKEFDYQLAP